MMPPFQQPSLQQPPFQQPSFQQPPLAMPRGMPRGAPALPNRGRPRAVGRAPVSGPPASQEPIVDFGRVKSLQPNEQKNYIGECIYTKLLDKYEENTGKITGMLLELPQQQLMAALQNEEALSARAEDAYNVLLMHLKQMENK